jgi:anti-sigma factor RsiW
MNPRKDEKKLLHRALDGEMTKSETRKFERKIQTDAGARQEFEQLKKVVKDTEKLTLPVPPDFTRRVLDETRKRLPGK